MAPFADPECAWCGGFGLDAMTGDVCLECSEQDVSGEAKTREPEAHIGHRCRSRRSASKGVSLQSFLSDAAANKGKPRRRPLLQVACCNANPAPQAEANSASSGGVQRRTPKVRFNLDVVEYPITPMGKIRMAYEYDMDAIGGASSSEDDDDDSIGSGILVKEACV